MTTYRLFPSTNGPSAATSFSGPFGPGVKFKVTSGGLWLTGFWWWVCSTGGQSTSAQKFALWQVYGSAAGLLVPGVSVTSGTLSAGWNYVALATPVALTQGATYQAATAFSGAFPLTNSEFASGGTYAAGIVNGPLTAFSDGTGSNPDPYSNSQCTYQTASSDPTVTFASNADAGYNGWLDVQVSDTAPSGASYRLWPDFPDVLVGVSSDTTGYLLATEFSLSAACALDRIWHYSPSGAASLPTRCSIWNVSMTAEVSGAGNTSPTWLLPGGASASAGGGWVYCDYTSAGVALAASTNYKVATYHASGSEWMAVTPSYWSTGPGGSGITNGVITAPDSASATPGQGSYETTWSYPSLFITGGENYWVDVEVTPSGGAAHSGAATLSGSGSLGAGGLVTQPAAATLSGSGSLAAQALVTQPAAAALAGSGALSAPGTVQFAVACALSGSGAFSSQAAVTQPGAASLTGSGSLAASASVLLAAAATLAGTGALGATALATQPASAALSGSGSIAGAVSVQFASAVTLAGSGTLTATALVVQPGAAALSGSGTLTAAGSVSSLTAGGAALSGSGVLAAGSVLVLGQAAALAGSGTVTAAVLVAAPGAASLSGAGILLAAAAVTIPASAALSGQGTVSAAAAFSGPASAALAGTGALAAGSFLVLAAGVTLAGTGTITVTVQATAPVTEPPVSWSARPAALRWKCTPSPPRWRVVMALFAPIAAISLECVNVTWQSGLDGTTVDPTGQTGGQAELPVYFAFPSTSGNYQEPAEPSTWYAASWLLGGTGIGYVAQCLVGPGGGAVTLAAGQAYDTWCRITGNPEAPARFVGVQAVY